MRNFDVSADKAHKKLDSHLGELGAEIDLGHELSSKELISAAIGSVALLGKIAKKDKKDWLEVFYDLPEPHQDFVSDMLNRFDWENVEGGKRMSRKLRTTMSEAKAVINEELPLAERVKI